MNEPLKFPIPGELFPFQHRYVRLTTGERIHYVDAGEGEVLLLLHGNPTWSFVYRKLIPLLQPSFRCIALDYPGFGLSEAPEGFDFTPRAHSYTVERFVDALEIRALTIVCQDWGGPIGLGLGIRRPDLVTRIVAGNTFAWPIDGDPRIRWFSSFMGGPLGRTAAYWFNGVVRLFLREGFHTGLTAQERRMFLAPFRSRRNRWPTAFFPKQLIQAHAFLSEVEEGLSVLQDRPTLLVWGTGDHAFRELYRERFEQLFPDHRTVLLKNAGHFWQYDAPEEVAAALHSW